MANWVNQRLRVFGKRADLDKLFKKTSSKKSPFDLEIIYDLVDGFECNPRDFERIEQVKVADIKPSAIPKKIDPKYLGKEYSNIETAWGWRPELFQKLASLFPALIFEIYYFEEGPSFIGAALFKKGELYGESIANIELEEFIYIDYEGEYEETDLDMDANEAIHLKNIYSGKKIDHQKRAKLIQEQNEKISNQYKESQKSKFQSILTEINNKKYTKKDFKKYETELIKVLSYDNVDLNLIPKEIRTINLLIAVLDKKSSEVDKLTPEEYSEELVNELCRRGEASILSNFPNQLTQPNQIRILLQNLKYGFDLKIIPENFRTNAVCWAALEKGSINNNFEHVPSKILTEEMILFSLKQEGIIQHLNPDLITQEIAELAVDTRPDQFQYIPLALQNQQVLNKALQSKSRYNYLKVSLSHIKNSKLRSVTNLKKIIKQNTTKLETLNENEKKLIWGGREGALFIKNLILNADSSFTVKYLIENIPEKFFNKNLRSIIAKNNSKVGYKFVPDKDKTIALTLDYINSDITLNVERARAIPKKLRTETVLKKISDNNIYKFYTLSDLAVAFKNQNKLNGNKNFIFFPIQLFASKVFSDHIVKNIRKTHPSFAEFFLPEKFQKMALIKKELKSNFFLYFFLQNKQKKYFANYVLQILKKKLHKKSNIYKKLLSLKNINQIIKFLENQSIISLLLSIELNNDDIKKHASQEIYAELNLYGKKLNKKNILLLEKYLNDDLNNKEVLFILLSKFFMNNSNRLDKIIIKYPKLIRSIQINELIGYKYLRNLSILLFKQFKEHPEIFNTKVMTLLFEKYFKPATNNKYKDNYKAEKDFFDKLTTDEKEEFYKNPMSSISKNKYFFYFSKDNLKNNFNYIQKAYHSNPEIYIYIPIKILNKKSNYLKLIQINDSINNLINLTNHISDITFLKILVSKKLISVPTVLSKIKTSKLNEEFLMFLSKNT